MQTYLKIASLVVTLLYYPAFALSEDDVTDGQELVSYESTVAPLLRKYCVGCHNADDKQGRLDLSSHKAMLQGGKNGAVITPKHANLSRLVRVLNGDAKPAMPPEDNAAPNDSEKELLARWVSQGAIGPDGNEPPITLVTPKIELKGEPTVPINTVAVSPDNKLIAAGSYGEVVVYDRSELKPLLSLGGIPGAVNSVVFSTDGQWLVTGAGETGVSGNVRVYNVADGVLLKEITGHRDAVYSVAISADKKQIASGGYDKQIILWSTEEQSITAVLDGHNGAVYSLAYHPNKPLLISASGDRTVKIWSLLSFKRLDTLSQSLKELYCLAISPDGQYIAAAGVDNRIRVWRIGREAIEGTNPLISSTFAHEQAVLAIAYSNDGQMIASSAEDGLAKVWQADGMRMLRKVEGQSDWIAAVDFTNDQRLVAGRLDGSLGEIPVNVKVGGLDSIGQVIADVPSDIDYGEQPKLEELLRVAELEPNSTVSTATHLTAPAVGTGVIFAAEKKDVKVSADDDLFSFDAKAGEQWVLETNAARNKSPLDSKIEVLGADGEPVPRLLLRAVYDSEIEFRPANSTQLGMRLKNYEEMLLNDWIYINGEVVKHFRARRGPDSDSQFYPGTGSRRGYFDTTPRAHPVGQPAYVVVPYPVGTEMPDNGLPVFTLNYENDDDGERKLGNDSRLTFVAPADGKYFVRVSDVRKQHGEDYKYELIVRRRSPSFSISVGGGNPTINAGNGKRFTFTANRIDDFAGEIRLDIEDVPPGFMVTTPLIIQDGHLSTQGVIYAHRYAKTPSADKMWGKITATAIIAGKEVKREVGQLGKLTVAGHARLLTHLIPDDGSELPVTKLNELAREFTAIKPIGWFTAGESELSMLEDMSLLASGPNPDNDRYLVKYKGDGRMVQAIRLEVIGDESLPGKGPGRGSENGNLVLSELKLDLAKSQTPSKAQPLTIKAVRSSFTQEGFSAEAVVDGKPEKGWAIAKKEGEKYVVPDGDGGKRHWLEFELEQPVEFGNDTILTATLSHSANADHNTGRFRITTTASPIPVPDLAFGEPQEITIVAGEETKCRISIERLNLGDRVSFNVQNLPHGVIVNDIGLNGVLITEQLNDRTVFLASESWVPAQRRSFFAEATIDGNQCTIPMILNVVRPSGIAVREDSETDAGSE